LVKLALKYQLIRRVRAVLSFLGKKWGKRESDDGDCDWIVSLVNDSGTSGWAPRKDQIDPRGGTNTDESVTVSRWPIDNAKYFSTQK